MMLPSAPFTPLQTGRHSEHRTGRSDCRNALEVRVKTGDTAVCPEPKHPRFAEPSSGERDGVVRRREIKVGGRPIFGVQSFVLGKRHHVRREQHVLLVGEIDRGGPTLVGVPRDIYGCARWGDPMGVGPAVVSGGRDQVLVWGVDVEDGATVRAQRRKRLTPRQEKTTTHSHRGSWSRPRRRPCGQGPLRRFP